MADDKVAIWNQSLKLGRAPASGELLVGDGDGFELVDIGISNNAGTIEFDKPISVDGLVESTLDGFKFPDGTTQTTAATNISSTQTDFISGLLPAVVNTDYRLVVNLPYGLTVTKTTTICTGGTATATFKINSTALGGTENSVSTSEQAQTHSSSNAASAGDDLVMTISSNSSCLNLSFTIEFTRALS